MNFPFYIAKRYFFFGKVFNLINIVSLISILVVAIVTLSLVTALSVFNGLEDLIRSLYNTFDPQIKISASLGKSFSLSPALLAEVRNAEGVAVVTEVIEDNALLKYKQEQIVVKVKGVSDNFLDHHRLDSMIVQGELKLHKDGNEQAIIGRGVQYLLSVSLTNDFYLLQLLYPRNSDKISSDPQKLIVRENIFPGGVFAIEKQYDDNYIFVPLTFAQRLFQYGDRRTALEIKVKDGSKIDNIKKNLQKILGKDFLVQNSDEQHASLLKAVNIEKFFMHSTISFILAIASCNIFFCLTMLAIKKRKDVAILFSLGATPSTIKYIFLLEGALISFTGAGIGLVAGVTLCYLQQEFGLVSMGMETSLVDAYPVKMKMTDFISTAVTIIVITITASYRPAAKASRINIKTSL